MNLFETLKNDPAYKDLIKTLPPEDVEKIDSQVKEFLKDFEEKLINPFAMALSQADKDKIKESLKTKK